MVKEKFIKYIMSSCMIFILLFQMITPAIANSSEISKTIDNLTSITNSVYSSNGVTDAVYGPTKNYIVKFKKDIDTNSFISRKKLSSKKINTFTQKNILTMDLNAKELSEISKDKDIAYVEKNATASIASVGTIKKDDTLLKSKKPNSSTIPWGIKAIGADLTMNTKSEGKNIKVAVLDTGIAIHPDLNISGGISFITNNSSYSDDNGHGTHVAGTIAALNNKFGVVGTAPLADLYAVKVLDNSGSGNYAEIIQGIYWAIDNRMDIISMSFGGSENSQLLHEAIQEASNNGILIVAAAGNRGRGAETELYPALFPEVISVGATDKKNQRAVFSSTGSELDIVAPGTDILSTTKDGQYALLSGTSMAVPHVTGAAATLWAKNKKMSSQQIKNKLYETATALGNTSEYGHGLINVAKALGLVTGPIPPIEQPDNSEPPTTTPDGNFDINKKDVLITNLSKQLKHLKERAIEAKNIPLSKEIDSDYNQLLMKTAQLHQLPDQLKGTSKSQRVLQSATVSDYFTTNVSGSLTKIENIYKSLLTKYANSLNTSLSSQSNVNILSFDKIGDGQSIAQGGSATVSLTLDYVTPHPTIEVTVQESATHNIVASDILYPGNNINPSYTWHSSLSNRVGEYVITFHYPDALGWDDHFTIYVTSSGTGLYAPTGLQITNQTRDSLTISWNPVNGANSYLIQKNGTPITSTNGNSYTFTGLTPNTSYMFGVAASNSTGTSNYSTIQGSTQGNSAPTGLYAVPSYNSITLSWTPVTDATLYTVKLNGATVGTTSSPTYTFTGLSVLTSYSLSVSASYPSGISPFSMITSKTTAPPININNPIDVDLPSEVSAIYSFTPNVSGTYRIFSSPYGGIGSPNDTLIDLYSDPELTKLVVPTADDSNDTPFSELTATLQSGVVYYVKLYGFETTAVHARLTVNLLAAIATIQSNTPIDIDTAVRESRVYELKTLDSGWYTINTSYYGGVSNGINNDTVLNVFSDVNLTNLVPNGHNDDTETSTFSEVKVYLTGNTSYFINVDGYGNSGIHARLLVIPDQITQFVDLINKEPVNISKNGNAFYKFTPSQSGLYRFFTSPSQISGNNSDTILYLYSDAGLNHLVTTPNDDVVGPHPYGELYSKIEYTLTQGTTYYIVVGSINNTKLNTRLMVEDNFYSTKTTAKEATWNTIYTSNISSLYDTEYYKITVTSPVYVKINISANNIILEDNSGHVLKTSNSSGVYSAYLSDPGYYYVKVVHDGSSSGVTQPVQYSFSANSQTKPDWYRFTMNDGAGGSVEVYLSDIGGSARENSTPISAIVKRNNQTVYKQYSLSASGMWSDTGLVYAGAPGQSGGVTLTSVEVMGIPSVPIVIDIQQSIDDKINEIKNAFYNYLEIDPSELTDEDKMMLVRGIVFGVDDNVYFGAAQWAANAKAPESNYYYMRAKALTDTIFTAAYTMAAAGSAAAAVQALIDSGSMGAMALAASPTGVGGAVLGAASLEELARAAALSGVSYLSGKMAMRSQGIVKASVDKLKETLGYKIRNVGDDILDRFEGYPNANGGHTLRDHVSMTNEELVRRAIQEELDATSFENKSTAIKAVQQNLRKNASQIEEWLKNSGGIKAFEVDHGYSIGFGAAEKTGTMRYNLTKSRVVLVRDSSISEGFYILTSFPIF
ncbi:S8 family serine peptidase [Paenibacillus sp. SYP-B3998]|uniref:S8 family serine peptidase n=1 Tax=Paenibacillus sp. SYP-B3998 TaxID=2678564 RepID=A0A6G4A442_9BACL|nr:S8 family serine peptidase [Paenibacillus sp. SYP-B3998]NEW09152.1 S8 family serine peptidase [Paenibacillus sp. SYP-B3998]